MDKKAFSELWYDDGLEEIEDKIDDSWRHGNNHTTVFKDEEGRYWRAYYRVSGDGEYHGLRPDEMDFEFEEVTPVKKMVEITEWITKK